MLELLAWDSKLLVFMDDKNSVFRSSFIIFGKFCIRVSIA